ncbi:hypothetical protein Tco_0851638, partial [Tanacetum coccineum]
MIWMQMYSDCDEPILPKLSPWRNLSHYGLDVLAEVYNPDNMDNNMINQDVQARLSFEQLSVKTQQLEPKLYDGNVIKSTSAIVILDSKETLMLAEESSSKMLLKQQDLMVLEKKNSMISSDPSPSCRPTKVEVLKELPKVSMIKDLVITTLKNELRKLKRKDLADNVVTKHTIDLEMLKVNVELIAPKLLNNRTAHSDYLRHTQEYAVILREIVEQGKSQNPLNNSLDSALQNSKLNANSKILCVKCNGCMLSDNHDLCVLDFINDVNSRAKAKSIKKIGNVCPLTRITTTAEVPLWNLIAVDIDTPKPIVTLVYSRKPKKSKTNVPVSKPKIIKSISANKKEPSKSWGSIVSNVPSSSLDECMSSKLFSGTIKFKNDHVAKILGYGDYQIGNVTISRVYYVEGLRHNLFFFGQFYDSNLEVSFRQHTCFIRNLESVDLLTGSRGNNLYTLSLGDMMVSFPICLLSKASNTKSWLLHRRLSHLNFGAINHLARHGL